ncbi:MAG: T9SS type A sorting domain-containing protein [Flavobacteriales bacterium]|nr:T9SS type A sorting domain-containing protein [Flavobacteriales bacterium]
MAAAGLTLGASAQSPIDIGLFPGEENMLEVRIRPTADFDGVFSSLLFTLRWDAGSEAAPGPVEQTDLIAQYMPIHPSGPVVVDGYHAYQVYAGFGIGPLTDLGVDLRMNEEVVLARIPISGNASFAVVNDAWTGELTHNGDYYVSLNGLDKTGIIYKEATAVSEETAAASVSISPNPNDGRFTVTFPEGGSAPRDLVVVNSLGQRVRTERLNACTTGCRQAFDLAEFGPGLYHLEITTGNSTTTHRVIVR